MALLQWFRLKLAQTDKHQVHFKCFVSGIVPIRSWTVLFSLPLLTSRGLTGFLLDRVPTRPGHLLMEAQVCVCLPDNATKMSQPVCLPRLACSLITKKMKIGNTLNRKQSNQVPTPGKWNNYQ